MGRTLRIKPVPERKRGPRKKWQVLVSGRVSERVGVKEGAFDIAYGIAEQTEGTDTLIVENRNGSVVDRRKIDRSPGSGKSPGEAVKGLFSNIRSSFF